MTIKEEILLYESYVKDFKQQLENADKTCEPTMRFLKGSIEANQAHIHHLTMISKVSYWDDYKCKTCGSILNK